jgi:hypothetical protein
MTAKVNIAQDDEANQIIVAQKISRDQIVEAKARLRAGIRPDANEQEILDSVERGEWRAVENIKREKIRCRTYAKPMDFKRRPF